MFTCLPGFAPNDLHTEPRPGKTPRVPPCREAGQVQLGLARRPVSSTPCFSDFIFAGNQLKPSLANYLKCTTVKVIRFCVRNDRFFHFLQTQISDDRVCDPTHTPAQSGFAGGDYFDLSRALRQGRAHSHLTST